MQKTLVRGRLYHCLSECRAEYIENGAMVINAEGRIESVGEYASMRLPDDICQTLDYSGQVILPGLIDTHIHLPQFPIRGKVAGTLLEWLDTLAFPVEKAFADPLYAKSLSTRFFDQLKAHGTTTAMVYASVHEASTQIAFEMAQASGMRVIMGKVMMDRNVPESMQETFDDSVAASERLAATWHRQNNDLIRYAFTPRFAVSCTPELLEAAGELQRRFPHSYVQTHLAENSQEIETVRALFPQARHYTEVYQQAGCLGPHTIVAHALHLEGVELEMIQQTDTAVSHCPCSNFFLKSGFFNLAEFTRRQIRVGLGTDIGAGPDISLFRVMRAMDDMQLYFQRRVMPNQALFYATLGGAQALSLEDETGNFRPGKSADFIVVDTQVLYDDPKVERSIEAEIAMLMFRSEPPPLQRTFVRGRQVYHRSAGMASLR